MLLLTNMLLLRVVRLRMRRRCLTEALVLVLEMMLSELLHGMTRLRRRVMLLLRDEWLHAVRILRT